MEDKDKGIKGLGLRPDAKAAPVYTDSNKAAAEGLNGSTQHSQVQHSTVQHNTAKRSASLHGTAQGAASRRRGHKGNGSLTGLVVFSGFFLGLVLGMVLVNFKKNQEINEVKEELATVIEEQSAVNVTNVYVPERKIEDGKIAMNSYDTDSFRIDNGFMAYFDEDGNKISHLGCDLSYHNDDVDWDELKASGCEFVFLRIGYRGYTEGGLVEDEKFEEYAAEAQRVGLNLGVYFFTQATSVEEAEEEADYVLEILDGMELQYPIAYDSEYVNDSSARTNQTEISDELRSQMCIAFCERVKEKGYYPIIYASENWMRRNMDLKMLTDYEFWAPQYLDENDFLFDFSIWQYTEEGSIPGVQGLVDLDISMVDYASFVPAMRQAYLTGGSVITDDSKGTISITVGTGDDPQELGVDSDAGADDEVLEEEDEAEDKGEGI